MNEITGSIAFEEVGLRRWNTSTSGDDPQIQRLSQNISSPGRGLEATRLSTLLGRSSQEALGIRQVEQNDLLPPEMVWLKNHAKELSQYRGQWLLLDGYRLIGHSSDIEEIRHQIDTRGIRQPFVYYVPTTEEADFVF